MFFGAEAIERFSREKHLPTVAALSWTGLKRHLGQIHLGCLLQCSVDFRLQQDWLIAVHPGCGREQMELVAISACSVARPRITSVDPECDAIGKPRSSWVA